MRILRSILRSIGLAAALTLPVLSCDRLTRTRVSPVTRTILTDNPFPYHRVARVDLYIVSVSASLTPDTSSTTTFVTLAAPKRRINVLELQGGFSEELGAVVLPKGAISAVRMVIDTDSSSITLKSGAVLSGATTPGIQWQSSAGRPVLNALIHEQINVPDTGAVIVIDYDIGKAFIAPQEVDPASTDSGFIFSPVLRAADARRTGSIFGTVRAKTSGGAAVTNASLRLYLGNPSQPENTWSVLGTAFTSPEGAFVFTVVTPSAVWSTQPAGTTYILAVDPPPSANLGRSVLANLTVTAGVETSTGTIVLP